jgi:glycosyltransferase involved in cell wall biosynthesis
MKPHISITSTQLPLSRRLPNLRNNLPALNPQLPVHFGIIIPTYNRPAYLADAVDAVLAQNYSTWTLIVVNDASSADYAPVLPKLRADSRIVYIVHEKNEGCNAARNTAIDEAVRRRLDYVVFVDDEEKIHPRCLQVALEKVSAHPEVGWYVSNTSGETKQSSRQISREGYYDWIDDYTYGKALRGDKTHVVSLATLGAIRFDGRYRASNMWPLHLRLAKKTRIWGFPFPSKEIQYLEGGITKTTSRYPRTWLELSSRFRKHACAIRVRPLKAAAYKYLLLELLKTPKRAAILLFKKNHKRRPASS